jgi:hypothetical protein
MNFGSRSYRRPTKNICPHRSSATPPPPTADREFKFPDCRGAGKAVSRPPLPGPVSFPLCRAARPPLAVGDPWARSGQSHGLTASHHARKRLFCPSTAAPSQRRRRRQSWPWREALTPATHDSDAPGAKLSGRPSESELLLHGHPRGLPFHPCRRRRCHSRCVGVAAGAATPLDAGGVNQIFPD